MKIVVVNRDDWENEKIKNILYSNNHHNCKINKVNTTRERSDLFKNISADLLIIDLNLYDSSYDKLLKQVKNKSFEIAFLTRFPPENESLIKIEGVNFLIRPVQEIELVKLITKIQTKLTYTVLLGSTNQPVIIQNRLSLKENDGIRFVDINKICRFTADNNYTEIHLDSGERILSSKTLKSYEEELINHGFYRVHQSHLVPIKRIKKIISRDGLFVRLDNDSMVELSRRRKDELLKKMMAVTVQ